jgi:hypothetical protein
MPAGRSTSIYDDTISARLRPSRWALVGIVALVLLAAGLVAMALAPDDPQAGLRTPWFASAFLLVPAGLLLAGAAVTWWARSGVIVVGRDGVRIVAPGYGAIELAHDEIRAFDRPPAAADTVLHIATGRRNATLTLLLTRSIRVMELDDRPGEHRGLTQMAPYSALVLAPWRPERVVRALETPPYAQLPKRPPWLTTWAPQFLRAFALLGAPVLAILVFGSVAAALDGDDADPAAAAAQRSWDTEGRSDLPPALPGFTGSFFRGAAHGGTLVYAWRDGRTASVRIDTPPLHGCGPWDIYWEASTTPDRSLAPDGLLRDVVRRRVSFDDGGYRDVAVRIDARFTGDGVRVAFRRVDQYGGEATRTRCVRSGSAVARRAG